MLKEINPHLRFALHLDHGDSFELCKSCIDSGFSSVMIDGSHHSFKENIAVTRKVVEYAHQYDVSVEGELGVLAGIEDEVVAEHSTYTQPEEVIEFVKQTGVGHCNFYRTSHGAINFVLSSAAMQMGCLFRPLSVSIFSRRLKRRFLVFQSFFMGPHRSCLNM
jgi:fructose-bisphosphate aldolase class II